MFENCYLNHSSNFVPPVHDLFGNTAHSGSDFQDVIKHPVLGPGDIPLQISIIHSPMLIFHLQL